VLQQLPHPPFPHKFFETVEQQNKCEGVVVISPIFRQALAYLRGESRFAAKTFTTKNNYTLKQDFPFGNSSNSTW